ncbi:homoserine kinase [Carnobacterium sp. 17-4]|uniref:homoserine kinase n=1 Tax=Carnobacterium sp. (strain 17-4) TaxID=208596 RepID=UPI00020589F3|nr:homoserine kinase [Carnobacterium sp. 17-4]AEB29474.1 homoserine kinase [Carnobacterium sp. 17-4]
MKIIVPGTTSNLGPGFDSCGLALNLYLTLKIGAETDSWIIHHQLGESIPKDETNLIIQTALSLVPTLTPRELWMESEIPATRGLGSSSAAIIAGIEMANQLAGLQLSDKDRVTLASNLEGHPDNAAPAILGDFVVASKIQDSVYAVKHTFPDTGILAVIPTDELLTKESRDVLPKTLNYAQAVQASSISNVMIAAVLANNLNLAGEMMGNDLWHENYRKDLVPHLSRIRSLAKNNGAYATFLSGAGSTVLILVPYSKLKELEQLLKEIFTDADVRQFSVEREGIQVKK